MNLELLESFGQNYPEEYDGVLDCVSIAVTACFNRRGTLIAVGCNDGRIVLWDTLTRGVSKVISAHVHPVSSVSWSRDGRKILTSSTDNTVCIMDVLTGDSDHRFNFAAPVLKAQYHPRNANFFLVCALKHATFFLNVDGTVKTIPVDDGDDKNITASFDRRGDYIYTGDSKGKIGVYNTNDMKLVASFRIGVTVGVASNLNVTSSAVKTIEFARRGDWFLVNASDRLIRIYDSREILAGGKDCEPEPIQKLQDLVNKSMWKKCCFSGDGEYICAGSGHKYALYIWERTIGNLVKILHGPKGKLLLDVVWHPIRPVIASISSGVVSIWANNKVELDWSAFAPDFKHLDENIDYEERESEFDEEDEDKMAERQKLLVEEKDLDVDIESIDPIPAFCSSDEEGENPDVLMFLPSSQVEEEKETEGKYEVLSVGVSTRVKRNCRTKQKKLSKPKEKSNK